MQPLGIAFAGAGMVAELHHDALMKMSDTRLIGVFDPDANRREQRSREWGVKSFDSLDSLIDDPEVEAVYVLSPAETHFRIAKRCLQGGCHVFVEKPVALDANEIDQLAVESQKNGLLAMPGHNYAYIPEFLRLVGLVRRGELGRVRAAWITYAIEHTEKTASSYGGVLGELMVHHSYLAVALFGAPDRVQAGISEPAWLEHAAEDQAWMTWDYGRSSTVHLFASFAVGDESADPWTFVVKVLGTDGSASMTWRTSIVRRGKGSLGFGIPAYEESYENENRAFVMAVREQGAPISTIEDAATVSRIIRAAYQGASERCAIERTSDAGNRW